MFTKDLSKIDSLLDRAFEKKASYVFGWQAPSNIALIKYWGKKDGDQIPANASISLTLKNCVSKTQVQIEKGSGIEFLFDGKEKSSFLPKIESFLNRLDSYWGWSQKVKLIIKSENNFPHAAGIASSASGFAALASCLAEFDQCLWDYDQNEFLNQSSFAARIGSGSACRSMFSHACLWGDYEGSLQGKDDYGITFEELHPVFKTYQDSILIISYQEKKVSSTIGHGLMKGHPYQQARYDQAKKNMDEILNVLKSGDLIEFNRILELEALGLHSMMMTSNPSFILMEPNTLSAIEKIREFRETTGHQIGFTLDAGANVHLLYPEDIKEIVHEFINISLKPLCHEGRVIHDQVGNGAEKLHES